MNRALRPDRKLATFSSQGERITLLALCLAAFIISLDSN